MKTRLLYHGLPLLMAGTTFINTTLWAQDAPAGRDQPAEPKLALEPRNSAASGQDPWQFSVVPLLWLSGVNGNVTVNGRTADVDVGFDKLFQSNQKGANLVLNGALLGFDFHW